MKKKYKNFKEGLNIREYLVFDENIKVHPSAVIGKESGIGENSVIHNSSIGSVNVGDNCIIGNYSIIEDNVDIGDGSKVWNYNHIRSDVKIGKDCILGDYVFIDSGVKIGDGTKIQNYVPVYHGVELDEGVFLGPNSLTTNDMYPRARTDGGNLKGNDDWSVSAIHIGKDASIGAGAVIKPGVRIGARALVGAGAVVTKDVPDGAIVVGNPAKILRYI